MSLRTNGHWSDITILDLSVWGEDNENFEIIAAWILRRIRSKTARQDPIACNRNDYGTNSCGAIRDARKPPGYRKSNREVHSSLGTFARRGTNDAIAVPAKNEMITIELREARALFLSLPYLLSPCRNWRHFNSTLRSHHVESVVAVVEQNRIPVITVVDVLHSRWNT